MTYEYDSWGNIQNKKTYAYTTATDPGTPTDMKTYGYSTGDWKDQLISYGVETISYDAMGNPTTYRGKTLIWRGKQLTGVSGGAHNYSYIYDTNGLRQQKTEHHTNPNDDIHTYYYYNGSILIGLKKVNDTLRFSYDAGGQVQAVDFNGTYYYYLPNGQGDIVKLIDGSKNTVVEYTYDSWGKQLSCAGTLATTLGALNPFRYRGYVYDEETGFYYLKSRYYDPETCRFISADVLLSTGQGVLGHNTYAYCLNNSVLRFDSFGKSSAIELFFTWIFGNGEEQIFGYDSDLVRNLLHSKKMRDIISNAIDNYRNGQFVTEGHAEFTGQEDGYDLYLSLQHFSYYITVHAETRVRGIWFCSHLETRYIAYVTVIDTYNFDNLREWNSFGNDMNNLAFIYHNVFGGGSDFEITAEYQVCTKWFRIK